ncbi:hypothetical protein ACFE04_005172 [Oxalis oulophora]
MAKLKNNNSLKYGLKFAVKSMLQKSLSLGSGRKSSSEDEQEESRPSYVPKDVKAGHFAVIAVDNEEPKKRFVVPLSYLSHPRFIRLLEEAAEEYGFDRKGALTIPCRPSDLERFLANQQWLEEKVSRGVTLDSYHHNNSVESF